MSKFSKSCQKTTKLARHQPNSISQIKFSSWVNVQGHKVKIYGIMLKVLSERILTWNMKALSLPAECKSDDQGYRFWEVNLQGQGHYVSKYGSMWKVFL